MLALDGRSSALSTSLFVEAHMSSLLAPIVTHALFGSDSIFLAGSEASISPSASVAQLHAPSQGHLAGTVTLSHIFAILALSEVQVEAFMHLNHLHSALLPMQEHLGDVVFSCWCSSQSLCNYAWNGS